MQRDIRQNAITVDVILWRPETDRLVRRPVCNNQVGAVIDVHEARVCVHSNEHVVVNDAVVDRGAKICGQGNWGGVRSEVPNEDLSPTDTV